jgi:hypothetical protein
VTEIQVNQPIDPKVFELHFPKGTSVADEFKGVAYLVDADEQPKGESVPLLKPQVKNINEPTQFATGDPRNRSRFSTTLIVSLAVAGVAGAIAVFGWLRRRKAQAA